MAAVKYPWKNGPWSNSYAKYTITFVNNNQMEVKNAVCLDHPDIKPDLSGSWISGDFGPAHPEVTRASRVQNYNWKFDAGIMESYGVLNSSGTRIHLWGFGNSLEVMDWMSDQDLSNLRENRDSATAPTSSYKTRNYLGKIFWFSGPAGAGKSTVAQMFARSRNSVYYEADCFSVLCNPFVDLYVQDPSMVAYSQKPLKVSTS